MDIDWFSSEEHLMGKTTPEWTSNLFSHEKFVHVLDSFTDWDTVEFPSYPCSLFELLCWLLKNISNCSRLPLELGPLLVYAWLKFRSIFSVIPYQEPDFFLNVSELIFNWFPYICRTLNAASSAHPVSSNNEKLEFFPCSFCKVALMECEYLISRCSERLSDKEDCVYCDVDLILRVFVLGAKISNYLSRQDNCLLSEMDLSDTFVSSMDNGELKVSFNQFAIRLLDTWNDLREQQRLVDDLIQFRDAVCSARNADDLEAQLFVLSQKLPQQLSLGLIEERVHKYFVLCDLLDMCIQSPASYQSDCSLLSCITSKMQIVSSFVCIVSGSSVHSGHAILTIQRQICKSFDTLKRLSSFLKELEEKQNGSSANTFPREMVRNILFLFASLCLFGITLVEMKYRGECLDWLVKSVTKYRKRLMFLILCISKTCELLLSISETCIIQSTDEHVLNLMGRCLSVLCVVLRYMCLRETLHQMKAFRSIIQVYCTCLRRWMNASNACEKEPVFITMEWNKNSNSFIEEAENPSTELAACYYYRYGLRAPFISDEELKCHWLTRELSPQSFIKSLDPAKVVEFYYAFREELKESVVSNRKGSQGEMKRTLNALLEVFFSVTQPPFEPRHLFDDFKSSLANIDELDSAADCELVFSGPFASWIHRGQHILEQLRSTKGRSSVDTREYREVVLDICELLSFCISLELELARKKLKSMSLNSYFESRQRLLEELLGLQLFSLSLETGRAQNWLWLGEIALELSHIHNEVKHLEMDEKIESCCIYFHFEECAKIFGFVTQLLNCSGLANATALRQMALQGQALSYFLMARQTTASKSHWHRLAARALDILFQMNNTKPIDADETVSLLNSNLWSWWYFLLLRGKLAFKLREPVESICWFLREAIVSHREEATRLKQELEVEPFYQFDMIRLKILLHFDEFSFSSHETVLLDDSVIYSSNLDDKKTEDSVFGFCSHSSKFLGILSNQVIQHMNYVWESHQFRNGSRTSGYLYKPYYAQAMAYKVGLQMYQSALDSVR